MRYSDSIWFLKKSEYRTQCCGSRPFWFGSGFHLSTNPDPTFHLDTDPAPTIWCGSWSDCLLFQRGTLERGILYCFFTCKTILKIVSLSFVLIFKKKFEWIMVLSTTKPKTMVLLKKYYFLCRVVEVPPPPTWCNLDQPGVNSESTI